MQATMERPRPINVTKADGTVTTVNAATAMAIEQVLKQAGINIITGRPMVEGGWAKPGHLVNPGQEVAVIANILAG